MGHRPDLVVRILDHQDPAGPEGTEEVRAIAVDLEEHEVGRGPGRVEATGCRLSNPAGRLDAVQVGQAFSESTGVGVVFG